MGRILSMLILVALFLQSPLLANDDGWKPVKESNGIQVYTRDVPGSAVDEFKGVGIVDARIEVIASILRDVPAAVEWMADTIHAEKIKQLEGEDMIAFNVTKLPWPLKPRESLVHVQVTIDYKRGYALIDMSGMNDTQIKPVGKDHVRMKYVHAAYILEYVDREHTRVTYMAKVDPGGNIPVKVANLVTVKLPYDSIQLLRKVSTKQKYVEAGKGSKDREIIDRYVTLGYLNP